MFSLIVFGYQLQFIIHCCLDEDKKFKYSFGKILAFVALTPSCRLITRIIFQTVRILKIISCLSFAGFNTDVVLKLSFELFFGYKVFKS